MAITAEFVLEQSIWPPDAKVIEVMNIETQWGTPQDHACTVQGLDLGWLCGPTVKMLYSLLGFGLAPVIDAALQELLNYILKPSNPEDPDSPAPPIVELMK